MSPADRRVALVTGGGRRIGAAICRAMAGAGFAVALSFRTSRREASRLAREIGGRAISLDIARPASIDRAALEVSRVFGRLDLLVHNAAVFPRTPAETLTPADWDAVFAVNLRGPFLLTRALLPLLREACGGVCFLGDAGAGRLWPAHLPYCLSKIALERQAAAWRRMLSPGVRVGIVRPGLALRPEGFPRREWERLKARGDLRGPDSPGKIAAAVLRFARSGRYTSS
ncbi:MAG: pteridine reductase [Deltaproteobacteria bacterium]